MTAQVINFAQAINARRATAQTAVLEAARADRLEKERAEIADTLGGTVGALIVADVLMDFKAKEEASRYLPAYCDPANEVRGAKYDATRNLAPAEIAARIRADLKAAQKTGLIPAGCKFSVRTRTYSGGWSVDVRVAAIPENMRVTTEKFACWRKQFGDHKQAPMHWKDCRSEELNNLLDKVEEIRSAYNRDNSDSMVDYFDTRYYGSTDLDWDIRRAREAAEIAAARDDYWLEAN